MGPREFYPELPSTQDRAIELARGGAVEGTRVIAARQTAGRGRLDRTWVSPAGGLYLSIVLHAPPEHASLLPLSLGARLAQEFHRAYGVPFVVKWPNDVLTAPAGHPPRKVAGILVDRVDAPGGPAEVAGIGVNVNFEPGEFPEAVRGHAASLAELAVPAPAPAAVEELVVRSALRASVGLRESGGVAATLEICRYWLYGVGRPATLDGQDAGTIAGLGDDGELLFDRAGERVAIRAGDVRVEGAA
jgi:BirA family transcriptional regulator, biotin operon repressor / biotin---[acetyl-CoA-carboxylase] ligase